MNNVVDLTMTGEAIGNNFGRSVKCRDVNGDGYSDLIAGASGFNSSTEKHTYTNTMKGERHCRRYHNGEAAGNDFRIFCFRSRGCEWRRLSGCDHRAPLYNTLPEEHIFYGAHSWIMYRMS